MQMFQTVLFLLTLSLTTIVSEEGGVFSACREKGVLRSNYRLDCRTGGCFRLGRVGPCTGRNMLFLLKKDDPNFGTCTCRPSGIGRPFVYWPPLEACYLLYSQGPCKKGFCLGLGSGQLACNPYPCRSWGHKSTQELVRKGHLLMEKKVVNCSAQPHFRDHQESLQESPRDECNSAQCLDKPIVTDLTDANHGLSSAVYT